MKHMTSFGTKAIKMTAASIVAIPLGALLGFWAPGANDLEAQKKCAKGDWIYNTKGEVIGCVLVGGTECEICGLK
jgi:hypothetical protein